MGPVEILLTDPVVAVAATTAAADVVVAGEHLVVADLAILPLLTLMLMQLAVLQSLGSRCCHIVQPS